MRLPTSLCAFGSGLIFLAVTACTNTPASTATADTSLARDLQTAQTTPAQDTISKVERTTTAAPVTYRPAPVVHHSYQHTAPSHQVTSTEGSSSTATSNGTYYPAVPKDPGTHDVKQTKRDAAIGAGAGAVLGAVTSRNKVKGGIIGGVVGGILGGVVGNNVDKKRVPNP